MIKKFIGVRQSGKVILMKVTSRSRPKILLDTVRAYVTRAEDTKAMTWLFSFDEDDTLYLDPGFRKELETLVEASRPAGYQIVYGRSSCKIEAVNRDVGSHQGHWDILLNISDDQRPIVSGYDSMIRRAVPDHLDASLWYTDGQPRVNTQEIVGRVYYERFGYVYHPAFKSLWCDNLSTDLALFQGKCIRSSKQIVRHHHPAWGGPEAFQSDDLYRRNDKFWNEDKATYERLVAAGLDKLIKQTK